MKDDQPDELVELRRLLQQERAAKLRAVGQAMHLKNELESARRDLNAQLEAITSSRSWKITQPLRTLGGRTRPQNVPQAGTGSAAATSPQQASSGTDDAFAVSGREAWDNAGWQRLEAFLAGGRRLAFPCAAQPALSIVIVLYNKAHLDLLCFESVLQHADVSYELVLVDNASTDRTDELLERLDGVEIIRNQQNRGFGFACVQGAERARGEYLCFLNNDALLGAHGLSVALRDFNEDKTVGAVGGKILLADGRLQEAGSMLWNDGSAWGYGRGEDPSLPRYNFRRPVDYCSGAFLFTPRSLFHELGGFDERYFPAYYEDTDYCFKVWDAGLKVMYEPQAFIHHYESATQESAEAAKAPIAAHQAKFVDKWHERLTRHLAREGASIPYARFAAAAGGLRILWMDSGAAVASGLPESLKLPQTLHQLSAGGHHVTFVVMDGSFPGEGIDGNDVEFADAFQSSHYVFRELLSQYDIVWVRGRRNMEAFLQHLWNMDDSVPPIIYESDSTETISAEEDPAIYAAADVVLVHTAEERDVLTSKGVRDVRISSGQAREELLRQTAKKRERV